MSDFEAIETREQFEEAVKDRLEQERETVRREFSGYLSPEAVEEKYKEDVYKRQEYDIIDTWDVPGMEYFDELIRVSRHQIVWGCNYFDYHFGSGRIVWDKCRSNMTFSDAEIAYCSLHDTVKTFRYMWDGMMQGKSVDEGWIQKGNKKTNEHRIHPTQKPIDLYRWIRCV